MAELLSCLTGITFLAAIGLIADAWARSEADQHCPTNDHGGNR